MSDRNFDPDATRKVATAHVPALADAYEHLEQLVVDAGGYVESSGVSEELSSVFTEYHLLLRNATVESRQNYDGLGPKLVQIAEDDELSESEIAQALEALADETEGAFVSDGYTPMAEGQQGDSLTEAPSFFDTELGSGDSNRGEGVAR